MDVPVIWTPDPYYELIGYLVAAYRIAHNFFLWGLDQETGLVIHLLTLSYLPYLNANWGLGSPGMWWIFCSVATEYLFIDSFWNMYLFEAYTKLINLGHLLPVSCIAH